LCLWDQKGKAVDEVVAVFVTAEDIPSLDPPDHDMVKGTGDIKAGVAWHGNEGTPEGLFCQLNN